MVLREGGGTYWCYVREGELTGATATVSTLATVVGHPKTPTWAGKGGFIRGLPALPSRLSIRACVCACVSVCECECTCVQVCTLTLWSVSSPDRFSSPCRKTCRKYGLGTLGTIS